MNNTAKTHRSMLPCRLKKNSECPFLAEAVEKLFSGPAGATIIRQAIRTGNKASHA
jgi:hypothetical protein